MKHLRCLLIIFGLMLGSASVGVAQDFEKGLEAARAGDYETAFREWLPLAEHGNATAQVNLGLMYRNGNRGPVDNVEAEKWFRLAAKQGNARAQYTLGVMYDYGEGVPEDDAEAVKWYRLAAEQGDADIQHILGLMYRKGDEVLQDYAEAEKWFRLAAKQGDAHAQFILAMMYENGEGVLQSNVMAHMWYNIASANGLGIAGERRGERADEMTSADISKAQAMARECMGSSYKNCGW